MGLKVWYTRQAYPSHGIEGDAPLPDCDAQRQTEGFETEAECQLPAGGRSTVWRGHHRHHRFNHMIGTSTPPPTAPTPPTLPTPKGACARDGGGNHHLRFINVTATPHIMNSILPSNAPNPPPPPTHACRCGNRYLAARSLRVHLPKCQVLSPSCHSVFLIQIEGFTLFIMTVRVLFPMF